ncbi:hypothetical protein [Corynebacterium marquesiae]|uniref:hypothetical protein n=1 Tax=Corynebacterium marquesiae TaxID=2913503 RepID=UPI0038CF6AF1
MTIQDIQDQIRQLDDTQFQEIKSWVVTVEENRRAAQPAIEQAKQEAEADTATKMTQQLAEEHPELVEKPAVQADGKIREWEPWHPLRESTHYRYGDKTRHNGRIWRDVLDPTGDKLNVWEPGSPGIDERYWVEDEAEVSGTEKDSTSETNPGSDSGHKEWAVGLSVKTGEEYTHDGHLWRAKLDHTTHAGWIPSAATYAVWEDLGPLA